MPHYQQALVTGAGGFVGRYLVRTLAARFTSMQITCLEHSIAGASPFSMTGDLTDRAATSRLVEALRPDLVLHLAAQSSVGASSNAGGSTWAANAAGSIFLAEAIAKYASGATILNVSSSEVYGLSFLDGAASETTPLRPVSVYARSKAAAEAAFTDILPSETRLITVRPFNHTGPGQDERFVVPAFAAQIARIERGDQAPMISVGNLDAERELIDVRDVIEAYVLLIMKSPELPARSVFNIARGQAVRIRDILEKLVNMSRVPLEVVMDPARLRASDIPCAIGDARKLMEQVGWKPRISVEQTLLETVEFFRTPK